MATANGRSEASKRLMIQVNPSPSLAQHTTSCQRDSSTEQLVLRFIAPSQTNVKNGQAGAKHRLARFFDVERYHDHAKLIYSVTS